MLLNWPLCWWKSCKETGELEDDEKFKPQKIESRREKSWRISLSWKAGEFARSSGYLPKAQPSVLHHFCCSIIRLQMKCSLFLDIAVWYQSVLISVLLCLSPRLLRSLFCCFALEVTPAQISHPAQGAALYFHQRKTSHSCCLSADSSIIRSSRSAVKLLEPLKWQRRGMLVDNVLT